MEYDKVTLLVIEAVTNNPEGLAELRQMKVDKEAQAERKAIQPFELPFYVNIDQALYAIDHPQS